METALRLFVRQRAGDRCEYYLLHQGDVPFPRFHIEHILPRKHGGLSIENNLALACVHCNLHKGTNLTRIDPVLTAIVAIFHPRQQVWQDHFCVVDSLVQGTTATGRVTVKVLNMNAVSRVELRTRLFELRTKN